MKVYLIGVGMGNPATLTGQALEAIGDSPVLVGAPACWSPGGGARLRPLIAAADIAAYVDKAPRGPVGVLLSGDTGFYSGAKGLWPLLGNHEVITIPGISSLSYFCARLQTTWQDARLVSAHGRDHNAVGRSSAAPRSSPLPAGPPRRRTSAGPWPSGGWDRCASPWASG
ncbi:MAG: cobalt-precorrin-7 (C(5))-methyltransferase [Flavonifractor plautii]